MRRSGASSGPHESRDNRGKTLYERLTTGDPPWDQLSEETKIGYRIAFDCRRQLDDIWRRLIGTGNGDDRSGPGAETPDRERD